MCPGQCCLVPLVPTHLEWNRQRVRDLALHLVEEGLAAIADQLIKGTLSPKDLLMLTTERIQETLDDAAAREIAKQVGTAVSKWRDEAARHGLSKTEINRMASSFEHEDLSLASGRK